MNSPDGFSVAVGVNCSPLQVVGLRFVHRWAVFVENVIRPVDEDLANGPADEAFPIRGPDLLDVVRFLPDGRSFPSENPVMLGHQSERGRRAGARGTDASSGASFLLRSPDAACSGSTHR